MSTIAVTISVLIFIASWLLPFAVGARYREKLSIGGNIAGSVASIATLIIALLLFNKLGIEQKLVEKQLTNVLELAESIKNSSIILKKNKHTIFFSLSEINKNHVKSELLKESTEQELVFNSNYYSDLFKVWNKANDLYTPKSIATKLHALFPYQQTKTKASGTDMIVFTNSSAFIADTNQIEIVIVNDKKIKLKDYIILWEQVIVAIDSWLDENSITQIELNL